MTTENTNQTPATPATPAKEKTAAGKVIQAIESPFKWIGKEVSQLGKLFSATTPAIQADIKTAIGILQTIKTDVTAGGPVLTYLVKKAYPAYSEDQLQAILTSGLKYLTGGADLIGATLLDTLTNMAGYAATLTGNAHNSFWNSLANLIVAELQPSLPWEKVIVLVQWAYNTFFKAKS